MINSGGGWTGLIIYCAFFMTGAAGIIYQVVWTKLLHLVFGVTLYAVTSVLVAFMAGLSAGNYFGGKFNDKIKRPAAVYAVIEIMIGVLGMLSPFLINYLYAAWPAIHHTYFGGAAGGPAWFAARFLMCFGVLFAPTFLMGVTLPLLCKYLLNTGLSTGKSVGILYGINTLGALMGAVWTGFYAIENIGLLRSVMVAAAINVTAGLFVLLTSRGLKNIENVENIESAGKPTGKDIEAVKLSEKAGSKNAGTKEYILCSKIENPILLFVFVSGFVSLGYEIIWFRVISMLFNNAPYVFSSMLAFYLGAVALGSAVYSRISDRISFRAKVTLLVFLNFTGVLLAACGYGMISLFDLKHGVFAATYNFSEYMLLLMDAGLIIIFPVSFVMGATLPLAIDIISGSRLFMDTDDPSCLEHGNAVNGERFSSKIAEITGRIYAINTAGAIIGPIAAGFLMIPFLGLNNSLIILFSVSFLSTLWISLRNDNLSFKHKAGLAVVAIAAAVSVVNLPNVPYHISAQNIKLFGAENEIIFYRDDEVASVCVNKTGELLVDAHLITAHVAIVKLMAHVPITLCEKKPENMLIICLGEGGTLKASVLHEGMSVEVVELSPGVIEAFNKIYSRNEPLSRNAKIIENDGRNFVHLASKKYDIITIDPPPPLYGTAAINFHTVEFYEKAKLIMSDDGIISQWIPYYYTDRVSFLSSLKSFAKVFPDCLVMASPENVGILLLAKKNGGITVDAAKYMKMFKDPKIEKSVNEYSNPLRAKYFSDPYFLLSLFINDGRGILELAKDIPLLTDDLPFMEFSFTKYCDEFSELNKIYDNDNYTGGSFDITKICKNFKTVLDSSNDPVSRFFAAKIYMKNKMVKEASEEMEILKKIALPPEFDISDSGKKIPDFNKKIPKKKQE